MTERQTILYNYIVSKGKTTQFDICHDLPYLYQWSQDDKAHDHCPTIWSDITSINNDELAEHIIIIDNFTYSIGAKEQCEHYAESFKRKALKSFKRYWNIQKKINRDGQGNVFDENEFIRSFINECE